MEDQTLRDRLHSDIAAAEPPFTLRPESLARQGSRRRLLRRSAIATVVAGALAVSGGAFLALHERSKAQTLTVATAPKQAPKHAATGPADLIDEVVRERLPGSERLRLVTSYGGNWLGDDAVTDKVTDYHAIYRLNTPIGEQKLTVSLMFVHPKFYSDPVQACKALQTAHGATCHWRRTPAGNVLTFRQMPLQPPTGGDASWVRWVDDHRPGFVENQIRYAVAVRIGAPTEDLGKAKQHWAFTEQQLAAVATDLRLVLDKPATWPPAPTNP